MRAPFTTKPYVLFYTTKRTGGGVGDIDAIKLMKFAASRHIELVLGDAQCSYRIRIERNK